MRNRNIFGQPFEPSKIEAVWQKGKVVPGYNPNIYRKDTCGAWMKRSEHGNILSTYGWEIDHILPKSKGGSDDLSNLQPLQWENNRNKGDDYPQWYCKIRA
ncbi:MAG: HNH endonuclease signature motif containing protein [bacterium]